MKLINNTCIQLLTKMSNFINKYSFSIFNSLIILFIYTYPYVISNQFDVLIPWDGYIYEEKLRIFNFAEQTLSPIRIVLDTPEYYYTKLIKFLLKDVSYYCSRILLIVLLAYTSCLIFYSSIKEKSFINLALSSATLIIIYTNIPFQWLLNSGVMYRVNLLLCYFYFFAILTKYFSLNQNEDGKKILSLYLYASLFLVSILYSFAYILVGLIFVALIFYFSGMMNIDAVISIYKLKYLRKFTLINFVLFFLLSYFLYMVVGFDGYNYTNNLAQSTDAFINAGGFNSISGGILRQFEGLTDYTMYTNWGYRSFGTMNFHFNSHVPQLIMLCMLGIACYAASVQKGKKYLPILIFVAAGIFLSKGIQAPFGFLYRDLIDNFKLAQTIRTPDTKFGIFIFLSVLMVALNFLLRSRSFCLKFVSLSALIIYMCIAIPNILSGVTPFGRAESSGGHYAYQIDSRKDAPVLDLIKNFESKNISGLLFPGYGHVNTPSGVIGFRDYLTINAPRLFVSSKIIFGLNSTDPADNLDALTTMAAERKVGYIVIRKSSLNKEFNFCLSCLSHDSRFAVIYEDDYTAVYAVVGKLILSEEKSDSMRDQNIASKLGVYFKLIYLITFLIFSNLLLFYYLNRWVFKEIKT